MSDHHMESQLRRHERAVWWHGFIVGWMAAVTMCAIATLVWLHRSSAP